MKIVGIIPARYGSTRFPGKPLVEIHGKSMIQRVVEQAAQCGGLDAVVVATDDDRIFDHVAGFGGQVVMTGTHHESGTERCLEAIDLLNFAVDGVINIQGDEPFIKPEQIDQVAGSLRNGEVIATLAIPVSAETAQDPNKVKLVTGKDGRALYFSRSPIPFHRDETQADKPYLKHLGIYGYEIDTLRTIARLPISDLERIEKLEQLRWLENGYKIHVSYTDYESPAIDTPEDLKKLL